MQEREQLLVIGHGNIGFGEPADVLAPERAQQACAVHLVGKGVAVGEFDERTAPEFLDDADFRNHALHRLDLEATPSRRGIVTVWEHSGVLTSRCLV